MPNPAASPSPSGSLAPALAPAPSASLAPAPPAARGYPHPTVSASPSGSLAPAPSASLAPAPSAARAPAPSAARAPAPSAARGHPHPAASASPSGSLAPALAPAPSASLAPALSATRAPAPLFTPPPRFAYPPLPPPSRAYAAMPRQPPPPPPPRPSSAASRSPLPPVPRAAAPVGRVGPARVGLPPPRAVQAPASGCAQGSPHAIAPEPLPHSQPTTREDAHTPAPGHSGGEESTTELAASQEEFLHQYTFFGEACERLILLNHDPRELRDYAALLYHCGYYKDCLHYLTSYQTDMVGQPPNNPSEILEDDVVNTLMARVSLIMAEDGWNSCRPAASYWTKNSEPW